MATTTVNVHQAKTHLSDLLNKALAGEEVIIAKAGKPLAKIVRIERARAQRVFGQHRGQIWIADDFDTPLPATCRDGHFGNSLRQPSASARKAVKRDPAPRVVHK